MVVLNIIRRIIRWMVVAFLGSTILAVVILRFVPVYFTPLMFIRCAEQMKEGESLKLEHTWVALDDMSKYMPVAVMASEAQGSREPATDNGGISQLHRNGQRYIWC